MNPIIEAIDAGHVCHGTKCRKCEVTWPCKAIVKARADNHTYLPPIPATQGPIEPHKDHL